MKSETIGQLGLAVALSGTQLPVTAPLWMGVISAITIIPLTLMAFGWFGGRT